MPSLASCQHDSKIMRRKQRANIVPNRRDNKLFLFSFWQRQELRHALLIRRQGWTLVRRPIQVVVSHRRIMIPERLAVVFRAMTAVLNGETQRLLERHRIEQVPAVPGVEHSA